MLVAGAAPTSLVRVRPLPAAPMVVQGARLAVVQVASGPDPLVDTMPHPVVKLFPMAVEEIHDAVFAGEDADREQAVMVDLAAADRAAAARVPRPPHRLTPGLLPSSRVAHPRPFGSAPTPASAEQSGLEWSKPGGYLSTSPTTKNIEPSTATMSEIRHPGSSRESTCTLPNDADRSLSRYGTLSPRETR